MPKRLILILVAAGLLRFIGVYPGYSRFHNDEPIIYKNVISIIKNEEWEVLRYDYGLFPVAVNLLFYKAVFIPFNWAKYYLGHIGQLLDGTLKLPLGQDIYNQVFQFNILGDQDSKALYWTRYVTALISLISVVLIFLIGKQLVNLRIGLVASFLLAVNFKSVQNAHFGLPDTYGVFALLLVIYFSLKILHHPQMKYYVLAGIAVGLSLSVKYQPFSFLSYLTAQIITVIKVRQKSQTTIYSRRFLLGLSIALLIFLLINPHVFIDWERVSELLIYIGSKYGMGIKKLNLYPLYYLWHIDYGLIMMIAGIVGIILGLKNHSQKSLLLLAVVIPLGYVFGYYATGGSYVRNLINLTPIFALFVAIAVDNIVNWIKQKFGLRLSLLGLTFILFIIIFPSMKNTLINVYYYTQPLNFQVFNNRLNEILPQDAVVGVNDQNPAIAASVPNRFYFETNSYASLAELKERGVEYAIVNVDLVGDQFLSWMHFGLDKIQYLWEKPKDGMRNTFMGLATEELIRHRVYMQTKPWQAPEQSLVFVKINNWPEVSYHSLISFDFSRNLNDWKVLDANKFGITNYRYDELSGRLDLGSILFSPLNSHFPSMRISSPPIKIKGGYLYRLTGFIKMEEVSPLNKRNGFLRVDFYSQVQGKPRERLISSVSSRVYGTNEWVQKEVIEKAPEDADYLTVGFQVNEPADYSVRLDEVEVFESDEKYTYKDIAPIDKKFDLDLLYPNSNANL